MRPIRLVMQAFGPYAGYQELNMDELGKTGIYAITGETGAGKTTIFDAIVYALYGSGSGEDPDQQRLVWHGHAPQQKTGWDRRRRSCHWRTLYPDVPADDAAVEKES